jgi:prepilin-type N-terminal cleavage/methylation domain-containing protein
MKKAFTIVELIISIVVIGIVSVSLPMILSSANKVEEQTINQDIFFKSTTVMNDIISKFWDSAINGQNSVMVVTVGTLQADPALLTTATGARIGNFNRTDFDYRRFYPTSVAANAIQTANTNVIANTDQFNGIDSYNGRFVDESAGGARVRYGITVRYIPDTPNATNGTTQSFTWNLNGGNNWTAAANSTNLKRVTITATRTLGSGEVHTSAFSYFTSNIGSQELKTK